MQYTVQGPGEIIDYNKNGRLKTRIDVRTVVSVEVAGPEGLHGCVDSNPDVYLPLVPRREGDKQEELTPIEDTVPAADMHH